MGRNQFGEKPLFSCRGITSHAPSSIDRALEALSRCLLASRNTLTGAPQCKQHARAWPQFRGKGERSVVQRITARCCNTGQLVQPYWGQLPGASYPEWGITTIGENLTLP
jgi:hypothetical protein